MTGLEQEIFEKIVAKMDVDVEELEGFHENSPIFEDEDEISMGLDSVDALELVVLLYDEWNITVPSEDMKRLTTLKNIADYIREHQV